MARKFYKENGETNPAIKFELTAPTGYTEITNRTELEGLYNIKYHERERDGKNYLYSFTASMYLDLLDGTYTTQQIFDFEHHVHDLFDELKNGHWLTAQTEVNGLVLSGIYDQAMKDDIKAYIDNYVTNNY